MKRTLSVFLLACILHSTPSWAGAWLQEPGTAYVRFASGRLTTRERFDENGTRVQWDTSGGGFRNARYRDLNLHLYTEVGTYLVFLTVTDEQGLSDTAQLEITVTIGDREPKGYTIGAGL